MEEISPASEQYHIPVTKSGDNTLINWLLRGIKVERPRPIVRLSGCAASEAAANIKTAAELEKKISEAVSGLREDKARLIRINQDLKWQLYYHEYNKGCLEKLLARRERLLSKVREKNELLREQKKEVELKLSERLAEKDIIINQLTAQRDKLSHQVVELLKANNGGVDLERIEKSKETPKQEKIKVKKRPGARAGHPGWYRRRPAPEHIDRIVDLRPERCDRCSGEKIEDLGVESHIQEELIIKPQITEYRRHVGKCKDCGKIIRIRSPEEIKGGRLGPGAVSLAAFLKMRMGVPYEKIRSLFNQYGLPVTSGGLAGALHRASVRFEPVYETIGNVVKNSPVVAADETGWPQGGDPHWAWCFPGQGAVYYTIDKSRGGKVVDRVLGSKIKGVLLSDFYNAYNKIKAKKQKCLVHLMREVKKQQDDPLGDKEVLGELRSGLKEIMEKGKELSKAAGTGYSQGLLWQIEAKKLEDLLDSLSKLTSEHKGTQAIMNRINKHRQELLTFLYYPGVDFHNNNCERKIRPLVVFRKISQGSRTDRGAKTTSILISILETARARGVDFTELLRLGLVAGATRKQLTSKLFAKRKSSQPRELQVIGG